MTSRKRIKTTLEHREADRGIRSGYALGFYGQPLASGRTSGGDTR